jgi:hypothetical protein
VHVRWVPVITASMYTADKGWPCSWMVEERSNGSSFYQKNMLQQILCDGLRIILKRIKNFFFDSVIAAILISHIIRTLQKQVYEGLTREDDNDNDNDD